MIPQAFMISKHRRNLKLWCSWSPRSIKSQVKKWKPQLSFLMENSCLQEEKQISHASGKPPRLLRMAMPPLQAPPSTSVRTVLTQLCSAHAFRLASPVCMQKRYQHYLSSCQAMPVLAFIRCCWLSVFMHLEGVGKPREVFGIVTEWHTSVSFLGWTHRWGAHSGPLQFQGRIRY